MPYTWCVRLGAVPAVQHQWQGMFSLGLQGKQSSVGVLLKGPRHRSSLSSESVPNSADTYLHMSSVSRRQLLLSALAQPVWETAGEQRGNATGSLTALMDACG